MARSLGDEHFFVIHADGSFEEIDAERVEMPQFVDMGVIDCDSRTLITTSREYGEQSGMPYRVRQADGNLGPLTHPAAIVETELEDERPIGLIDTELE